MQVAVARHVFFTKTFSVQKQFNIVRVGVHPYIHGLPFPSRPCPVRGNVQYVFIRPPRLIVVVNVFWKTTHIHQTKMRTHIRPFIRRRFTPVIKACPDKTTHHPLVICSQRPPLLSLAGPPWRGYILVGNISPHSVCYINATGGHGAAHLRSHHWLQRMVFVVSLHKFLPVVEATNGYHFVDSVPYIAHISGVSTCPCGVKFFLLR